MNPRMRAGQERLECVDVVPLADRQEARLGEVCTVPDTGNGTNGLRAVCGDARTPKLPEQRRVVLPLGEVKHALTADLEEDDVTDDARVCRGDVPRRQLEHTRRLRDHALRQQVALVGGWGESRARGSASGPAAGVAATA